MENNYQKLVHKIHAPDGLDERVLSAALRAAGAGRSERRSRKPALRAAVCAVCALALVLGTVTLRPAGEPGEGPGAAPAMRLDCAFGLTACAAGTGQTVRPNANGGLAFLCGEGQLDEEEGCYTGCLFQVEGEKIQTVSLAIDRGGLCRYVLHTGMTDGEIAAARQAMAEGTLTTAAITREEDGGWSMPEMTALGSAVSEDYDPAVRYGFWVPPEEITVDRTMDMQEAFQANVDVFDGAVLTVAVTLEDGTIQSRDYRLSTGRLKTVREGGTWRMLPMLAGEDEPYLYGIYAVSETESRWLEWPVQGASTISLSNPYGELDNGTVHAGIDIPAESGAPVLAAADGTVAEAGFDAGKGSYLVLDHGDGLTTLYAHCGGLSVEKGDTVGAGEQIAAVGATGMATGPHLHFEVRQAGEAQNPVVYFDSATRAALRTE